MATGMGETLHRSPRNAESFRIKRRAFRLVLPDGGLLVPITMTYSVSLIPIFFNIRLLPAMSYVLAEGSSISTFGCSCFFTK